MDFPANSYFFAVKVPPIQSDAASENDVSSFQSSILRTFLSDRRINLKQGIAGIE